LLFFYDFFGGWFVRGCRSVVIVIIIIVAIIVCWSRTVVAARRRTVARFAGVDDFQVVTGVVFGAKRPQQRASSGSTESSNKTPFSSIVRLISTLSGLLTSDFTMYSMNCSSMLAAIRNLLI
jgi:hypothetical protein